MQFHNGDFLWALSLGLVPIIIYYLMRYRSLKITWGANYVLELAMARLRKKFYLDQIILLALGVLSGASTVLFAAAVGTNSPGSAGRLSASGARRTTGMTTWASASPSPCRQTGLLRPSDGGAGRQWCGSLAP